jgi:hypothetical protein
MAEGIFRVKTQTWFSLQLDLNEPPKSAFGETKNRAVSDS